MKNAGRSSIFNLGDADTLTHKGHKIDEIDQFEKPGSDDEVRNSCYSTIQTYECARNVRYLDSFNIQYPSKPDTRPNPNLHQINFLKSSNYICTEITCSRLSF